MRALLLNLSQLAGMQVVLALAAIVRNKVLALRLGAEGYGEFTQIALFISTASILVAFGLGVGVNRNAAAAKSTEERQRVLANANGIVWTLTLIMWCALFILFRQRPELLEGAGLTPEPAVIWSLALLAAFIPIDVMQNNLISFLTGSLDIKGLTAGRSIAVMAGTIASVPLVWFFGLVGAALQTACISLLIVLMLARRCLQLGYIPWKISAHWASITALVAYGAASLTSGFAQRLSDFWVRAELIDQTSAAQNGYYQAALSLAAQVKLVVLNSVGSYSIAKLSHDTDRKTISRTANQLLEAVLPIAALALGLLGLLSLPLIVGLYRPSFAPAMQYLPWLLLAHLFEVAVWVIGAPLLALRRLGSWLVLELVYVTVRWAGALLLLPIIGPQAVVLGYLIAIVLHLALNAVLYFHVLELDVDPRHSGELIVGAAVTLTCALLGGYLGDRWELWALAATVWLSYLGYVLYTKIGLRRLQNEVRRFLVRNVRSE